MPALAVAALVGACSSPAETFDHTAGLLGLRREIVSGAGFRHVLYWRDVKANRTLHVYLGGDGTPAIAGQPAGDPTPRNPLTLHLLALDPGPAVFIGRPCYHGLADDPGCSPALWTEARYSEDIVVSLAAVVRTLMVEGGYERIGLFGHSGGGTLAMLLAERMPETTAVITIAANLDIDAWADHHGYSRLAASLNPAVRPSLPASIMQHHFAGADDRIVPPALVQSAAAKLGAETITIEGFDHVCCWEAIWPRILAEVAALE